MNTSAAYKEQIILEYVKSIDWKNKNISISTIKQELRKKINETPGIDLKWKKEELTTEIKGSPKVIESVKSINIAFTDGINPDGSPIVHSVTYFI